jgi:hypothetical protein
MQLQRLSAQVQQWIYTVSSMIYGKFNIANACTRPRTDAFLGLEKRTGSTTYLHHFHLPTLKFPHSHSHRCRGVTMHTPAVTEPTKL